MKSPKETPNIAVIACDVCCHYFKINQAMNQREVNPNELLPLIFECAAEKYKTCSIKEADHLTITLKALFQAHSNDTTLDRELFERAVKQVILQPDASVQLRLLNDIVV